jgi:predicted amidohydrolase
VSRLRIAAAQYPMDAPASFAAYAAKITRWCENAAREGADLLVFPEYGAMELAALAGEHVAADLASGTQAMQAFYPEADALHAALAQQLGVTIIAGSGPRRGGDGGYRNAARVVTPSGATGMQDKLIMTRYEREAWALAPGATQAVFALPAGARIGIAICYDVEFPVLARNLAAAGAEIILAPQCTDTHAGHWRVRTGAQARALENQCYVVTAPLVGEARWCPAVDVNLGTAGVFAPPDNHFPDDGVIAIGAMDGPQWLYADLDLTLLRDVRADGQQLNFTHWDEQTDTKARVVALA